MSVIEYVCPFDGSALMETYADIGPNRHYTWTCLGCRTSWHLASRKTIAVEAMRVPVPDDSDAYREPVLRGATERTFSDADVLVVSLRPSRESDDEPLALLYRQVAACVPSGSCSCGHSESDACLMAIDDAFQRVRNANQYVRQVMGLVPIDIAVKQEADRRGKELYDGMTRAIEVLSAPNPNFCPLRVQSSLEAYVRGLPPGDFIRAVLSNDLNEAIARADDVNIHALPHIVAYVREHLPALSWGSKANVDRWLKRTRSGVNTDGREGTINTVETERES